MVGLQTLDLAIGVRVPASQPKQFSDSKSARQCWVKLLGNRQVIGSNFPKKYNWSKFLRKLLPALLWTHSRQLCIEKAHPNPHAHSSELLCCYVLIAPIQR